MTHPLDGVWAKIERSQVNYVDLNRDASRWAMAAGETPTVTTVKETDPETGAITFRVVSVPDAPSVRWGTMLGDAIHNLRSALDHLAFALADLDSPNRGEDRITQFPITRTLEQFEATPRLRFLSDHHRAMVKREQPWVVSPPPHVADHPLSILEELDNADKHRVIHVVALGFDFYSYFPFERFLRLANAVITEHVIYEEPLVAGAPLMQVKIAKVDAHGPDPDVEMLPIAPEPNLSLGAGRQVKVILPNLNFAVRTVVSAFGREFS